MPQIESNLVKPIAILTRERSPMLPKLASAHEQGLSDFEASTWFGFFLPKGTPAPIIQKLHDATVAAMDTPSVQERLQARSAHRGGARAPLAGISAELRRERDREATPARSRPPASRSIEPPPARRFRPAALIPLLTKYSYSYTRNYPRS